MNKTAAEICNDIAFNGIISACDYIEYNANRIDGYARELTRREAFRTNLEASLDKTEATLVRALESVRRAKQIYRKLEAA